MPSSAPVVRRSPSRASGRALLVAAVWGAGTIAGLAGPGAALAAPTPTDPAPLVLRDATGSAVTSGDARADPSFASALLAGGCPADADDAARLSVTAGGATVVTSPTVAVVTGQPVEVPMAISFEEVVAGGVEDGGATLTLECLVVESGVPSSVVVAATSPVTFTARTWSVSGAGAEPTPPTDGPTAVPTEPGTVPSPTPTDGAGTGSDPTPRPSGATRPAADGDLAYTGGQIAGIGALAAGLLAGGTALVLRRRDRA